MEMDAIEFLKLKYYFLSMDKHTFLKYYQNEFLKNCHQEKVIELVSNVPLRTYREKMRKKWIVSQRVALRCSANFCVYIVNPNDHFTGYLALCSQLGPEWHNNILRRVKMPDLEQYSQIYENCKSQEGENCDEFVAAKAYLYAMIASLFKEVVFSAVLTTPSCICFGSKEFLLPVLSEECSNNSLKDEVSFGIRRNSLEKAVAYPR